MIWHLSFVSTARPGGVKARWTPVAVIVLFSVINYRGVRWAARTQNVLTVLKVAGLVVLIGSSFLHKTSVRFEGNDLGLSTLTTHGLVMALLGCFVAYDGWQYIAFVAGEVRAPSRTIPRSIALGTAAVILLYLLANVAYLRALPLSRIAATERVAALAAERTMGHIGASIVALTIVLSAAGAANGSILTSPRIYFAQARDGLFFRKVAEIHPRFGTPSISILAQCVWTCALALSGSYETLFSFVLFAMWLFHGMTVFGVIILRRKAPGLRRPYQMWGYPISPLLFTLFALWFVVNTLSARSTACRSSAR